MCIARHCHACLLRSRMFAIMLALHVSGMVWCVLLFYSRSQCALHASILCIMLCAWLGTWHRNVYLLHDRMFVSVLHYLGLTCCVAPSCEPWDNCPSSLFLQRLSPRWYACLGLCHALWMERDLALQCPSPPRSLVCCSSSPHDADMFCFPDCWLMSNGISACECVEV